MRYTYKGLVGFVLLLGLSIWLARTYSSWWYLFTLSCFMNSLRQAAYTTAATQSPPRTPYDWLGFGLHKVLYPIALPYVRWEFRLGESFWGWRRRKAPDSLLAAGAYAGAGVRSKRAAVLGIETPVAEAQEMELEEPGQLTTLSEGVTISLDRDNASKAWPYISAIYRLVMPFVIRMMALVYRFEGQDTTRREALNDPVPFYMDQEAFSADSSVDPTTLVMRETTYGGWNPVLNDLQNLYCGNLILKRYDKAFDVVQAAQKILEDLREDSLTGMGSRKDYIANTAFWMSAAFSIVPRYFVPDQKEIMRLYEALARSKAVEIDILSVRRQIVGGAPPQTRSLWKRISPSLSERVVNAMRTPSSRSARDVPSYKLRLRDQMAELYLGMAVAVGATSAKIDRVGWEQIVDALPQDSVLLDYYRYSALDMMRAHESGVADYRDERYFAFSLSADGLQYADLGAAEPIDAAARSYLVQLSKTPAQRQSARASEEHADEVEAPQVLLSRRLIWPFEGAVARASHLYISADSVLAQLPFVELATADGTSLVDRCAISFVESARQLASDDDKVSADRAPNPPVVIGSPDYDLGGSGGFAWFDDLAGVEEELDCVAEILGVPPIVGKSATEIRFKQICRPQVLHIATHGFYISARAAEESDATLQIANRWEALATLESPLLRSGLALAGINPWLNGHMVRTGEQDGILTAEDVLEMDLEGTEIAVLSACETGVGDAQSGQGVFGLRRAFAIAGARAMVVSLWKVSDEATLALMLAFYRYLGDGMSKAEALRQAQLDLRKSRSDPFEWAAFICLGDISPVSLTGS
jgi:CHAT domain-containing protein